DAVLYRRRLSSPTRRSSDLSDTAICIGETVPLWYVATGGGGVSSLTWSNGATTDTIYVSPATTTSYTVSGTGNCSAGVTTSDPRSEEHTSELQSRGNLVCRL